jgi:hypothetical protein
MMKRHFPWMMMALLVAAPTVRGENPPAKSSGNSQMYEDIEIMRRLLDEKLHSQYAPLKMPRYFPVQPYLESPDVIHSQSDSSAFVPHMPGPFQMPSFEGVYLKGQGVVFTITVPPAEGDPSALTGGTDKKSTSDWDRMRKQLRQDKPAEVEKGPQKQNQSLAEILLHAMAENGSHFSQLAESESLTVVVTFRTPDLRGQGGLMPQMPKAEWGNPQLYPYGGGPNFELKSTDSQPKGDPRNKLTDEQVLLGDLHHKQGKPDEAIAAYRKAMDASGDARTKALLLLKIAEVLKEQNRDKEALDTLQKVEELLKEGEPKGSSSSAETPTIPLPTKMIVSAPKKLLDQAAASKVTFEEFVKAATVELLSFSAPKK